MKRRGAVAVVGLIAIATSVGAESDSTAQSEISIEEFELYTKCLGVRPVIEDLPKDAEKISLDRDDVIAAVESRLRSSGLYQSGLYQLVDWKLAVNPVLYVNVSVIGPAFFVKLELRKHLQDPFFGGSGFAMTWNASTLGTHGGGGDYILSTVRNLTDKFINEWYKVNKPEGKCVE